jgi:hypothetical protein
MSGIGTENRGGEGGTLGRRAAGRRARRLGIGIFFASVGVNAALGIAAVLTPDFGETQGKVLGTSLAVTGAVVLALSCEPAWERRLLGPLPPAAATVGVIGFAMLVAGLWSEAGETWGRVTGSVLTAAVAATLACVLAPSRPAPRHAWVFTLTLVLLALGAGLVTGALWSDDVAGWYVRTLASVLIVLAALVVTIPVLHRIDRSAIAAREAAVADVVGFCPFCGSPLHGTTGAALSCSGCGRSFSVRRA